MIGFRVSVILSGISVIGSAVFVCEPVLDTVLEFDGCDFAVISSNGLDDALDEVARYSRFDAADVFLVVDKSTVKQFLDHNEVRSLFDEFVSNFVLSGLCSYNRQSLVNLVELIKYPFTLDDIVLFRQLLIAVQI